MEAKEIIGFIMILALVGILGSTMLFVNQKVDDKTGLTAGTTAAGTLTFSGNASCGEFINITTSAGTKITFEMNVTGDANCAAKQTWTDDVVMALNHNSTNESATNLTAAINANATISAEMTATNPSAGVVVLTYNTVGDDYNTLATTETLAAGAWAASTLSGGVDEDTYYDASQNVSGSVESGWDFTEIVIIAAAAALIIAAIFGVIGGYIKL